MRCVTLIAVFITLAGCVPIAHEQVTVQLASAPGTNAAESAVQLINEVMATNGFNRVNTSVHSNQDIVAGLLGPGQAGCFVYHRSDEIQVVINEMGRFKSRPEVIKTRDDLKRRLSEKFGKDKVSQ